MATPYEQGLPCLNPSCKSHGRPHPNCKCYGYAEGGMVRFCSGAHKPDCEYYMDDGGFIPDAPTARQSAPSGEFIPDSPDQSGEFIPDSESKYNTTGQQIGAGVEAVGRGLAGPLFTAGEKALGFDEADISGREEANPIRNKAIEAGTFGLSMLGGVGEAGLIAKAGKGLSEMTQLGEVGRAALRGAVEVASMQGSDEITKALLNKPGSNPDEPWGAAALNVGAAGLMGGLTGGIFSLGEKVVGKGLDAIQSEKGSNLIQDILCKFASDQKPIQEAIGNLAAGKVTGAVAGGLPLFMEMPIFNTIKNVFSGVADKIAGNHLNKINGYVTDAIIKSILTNSESELPNAVHYAVQIGKGALKGQKAVEALFKAGLGKVSPDVRDTIQKQIEEFMEDGNLNTQMMNSTNNGMAEGGMISASPQAQNNFANVFPEQSMLLHMAKGRIVNYLNTVRPASNVSKLAFDDDPSVKEQQRSYKRAIGIAANPLSILDEINNGKLTPESMTHFKSMFPESHQFLSKEMTKQITKLQMKKEKPPYQKRLGMGLFLGTDLDSTITAPALQAIQMTYAPKQPPQSPGQAPKGSKKPQALTKLSDSYQTDDQAREKRGQQGKG